MADEDSFDIVKATQYGILHRCRKLIEDGFDVNQRDAENITLLHWAAINCRKDIVQYYIDQGAVVDAVGGELQSTPLHWATRQGHLSMVVLLMKHGADPTLRDGEGCSAIHLASQFGYTPIVAYLLAKGVSPDLADRAGMTPLMWAVARVHSPDPARVIMTFGANTALQDRIHKNTALHMAIGSKNSVAVSLLLQRNASLDIPNSAGETGYMLLKTLSNADWIGRKTVEGMLEKYNVATNRTLCSRLHNDKKAKYWITATAPFLIMLFLGELFAADINIWLKVCILTAGLIGFHRLGRPVCDEHFVSIFPVSVYFATKLWMYITYFVYITPVVSTFWTLLLISLSSLLWYNFLNAWRGDAGVIKLSQQERHQTIIDLAEIDGFDPKHFCTSCLVRKPMRSKHCSVCDKCVARFDHHCPWLSNCVGWKNHKYFIGYLISLVLLCGVYINGAIQFWNSQCITESSWDSLNIVQCCPWINFMTMQAMVHGVWVFVLLSCQLYQILWLGMTTNERLNWSRYSYFQHSKGKVERTPFNNGWFRNFFDFFEMSCCGLAKVKRTDWARAFAPTNLQDRDYDQAVRDGLPLLTDKRDNYQYV